MNWEKLVLIASDSVPGLEPRGVDGFTYNPNNRVSKPVEKRSLNPKTADSSLKVNGPPLSRESVLHREGRYH